MKFKYLSIFLWAFIISFNSIAQENLLVSRQSSSILDISFQKTASIVFPASIKSVDRGSKDILVQKAKGVENVLLVKAGREMFQETNITVITGDGFLHSFMVKYSPDPGSVVYNIQEGLPVIFNEANFNEAAVALAAQNISEKPKAIKNLKEKKNKIALAVEGIYTSDDILYFQVQLKNSSPINYDLNFLRFHIRDKQKLKRTASQEIEMVPVLVLGDLKQAITKHEDLLLVFAIPKFTIPDAKVLKISLQEKNGGRHLNLTLKNKHLMKAKRI
jgi:conjugative transposon TraN protein